MFLKIDLRWILWILATVAMIFFSIRFFRLRKRGKLTKEQAGDIEGFWLVMLVFPCVCSLAQLLRNECEFGILYFFWLIFMASFNFLLRIDIKEGSSHNPV